MKLVNSDYFKPNGVSQFTHSRIMNRMVTGLKLCVFQNMVIHGMKPSSISSVNSGCTEWSLIQHGKEIHGDCIKTAYLAYFSTEFGTTIGCGINLCRGPDKRKTHILVKDRIFSKAVCSCKKKLKIHMAWN